MFCKLLYSNFLRAVHELGDRVLNDFVAIYYRVDYLQMMLSKVLMPIIMGFFI